jgi:diguanylate cyclase (GGDEF)-like protein/PAS domain S-box-containing protein
MSDISYEMLLENLFDGVYFVDINKKITVWNKGAERITGYTKAEVVGSSCSQNILRHIDGEGKELCEDGCPMSAILRDGDMREVNVYLHHKLGHRVPVSVRMSPVRDDSGAIVGGLEVFTDNSSALQILKELETAKKEAYLDMLTGVGNRRYGEVILDARIYEWHTHETPFGVIFLDIDHFKLFNDTYGHMVGDEVLIMVAKTISNMLRRFDIISRWGGEEFVVILANVTDNVLREVAERIRIMVSRCFLMLGEDKVTVTVSLGATLASHEDTRTSIIARADSLMYASKTGGRNRVTIG